MGDVPGDLHPLKVKCGDDPWHTYPLRDVGSQFSVEHRGYDLERLGTLSHSQLMREAYPGAVYYYMTKPFRVTNVFQRERTAVVRRDKQYTTDPIQFPAAVYPKFDGGPMQAIRHGELRVVECDLAVTEAVAGFVERRGSAKVEVRYPCDYWKRNKFSRNFMTTGVLLSHPGLNSQNVKTEDLGRLIMEAFLLLASFDRNDIAFTAGRHQVSRLGCCEGDRFLSIYDRIYGSLRLSGRLLENDMLKQALTEAVEIAGSDSLEDLARLNGPTLDALEAMAKDSCLNGEPLTESDQVAFISGDNVRLVIAPGSPGWVISDDNSEFMVESIFFHHQQGLCYRGKRLEALHPTDVVSSYPVDKVTPIPGISRLGEYDLNTGEFREHDRAV